MAYELSNVYRLLRELGFSWITSRSRHPKQDGQVQEALKTSSWKRSLTSRVMLRLPMSMSGFRTKPGLVNKIRLPTVGQAWQSPRAIQQQQFEYVYLFGAVCPATGTTEALLSPLVNREVMKQHLALIAARTKPGRHAVVIMDGAGWHTMECADDFPNLSLIKLPPYSPELNPIEQVWSWLRQHVANRSFRITTTSLMPAHRPGSTLLPMWERVMSLCSRDWIKLT